MTNTVHDFLKISPDNFYINKRRSETISLNFTAKIDTEPGLYTGKIFIKGEGKTKVILVAIVVEPLIKEPGRPLFDVTLTIPSEYRVVPQGGEIVLDTKIFNLGDPVEEKISVNYFIKDLENNIIATRKHFVKIDEELSLTKKIKLPRSLPEGDYIAIVEVRYEDLKAISSRFFKVKQLEYILLDFHYKDGEFELFRRSLEEGWSPTISHDSDKKYKFYLCSPNREIVYSFSMDDPGTYFSDISLEEEIEGGIVEFDPVNFYIVAPEKRQSEQFQILLDDATECEIYGSDLIVSEGDVYDIGARSCRIR